MNYWNSINIFLVCAILLYPSVTINSSAIPFEREPFDTDVCETENCIEIEDRIKESDKVDQKKCHPNFCRGEGVCFMVNNEPKCNCLQQYFHGPNCNNVTDNCVFTGIFKPCNTFGTEKCVAYFGGRYCQCRKGYYGTVCSKYSNLNEYFHPATSPIVYFSHIMYENEVYELRVAFENVADTYAIGISGGIGPKTVVEVQQFTPSDKFIDSMGLSNVPTPINQRYYLQMTNRFHGEGIFNIELELFNRKNDFEWKTSYVFQGRIMEKHLSFGSCPPIVKLDNGGCCFETELGGKRMPKLYRGIKYTIQHNILPCKDEKDLNITYYVTDLHDIHKIYMKIKKSFTSPPVRLNYTSSLVVRVDGPYGTTFAQCFVKYSPKVCKEPGCQFEDYFDDYGPDKTRPTFEDYYN